MPSSLGSKNKPCNQDAISNLCTPLAASLASSSSLKIEVIHFSEMSVTFYQITWCHIPEDGIRIKS
jgi:hypothetical protein